MSNAWDCLVCGAPATRQTRDTEEPLCEAHGGYDGDDFEGWDDSEGYDELDFDEEDRYNEFDAQDGVNLAEMEED